MCQSRYNQQKVAYCCATNDFVSHTACVTSPLCSSTIPAQGMRPVLCPHEKWSCGRSSPNIVLAYGQQESVSFSSQYLNIGETCHYTLKPDQVISDKMSMKRIQLYFDEYDGLEIHVSKAESKSLIVTDTIVSSDNRNFTMYPNQTFFVTI